MHFAIKSAIVLCLCGQSLAFDTDLQMPISSTHSDANNDIKTDSIKKCSEDLECDQV